MQNPCPTLTQQPPWWLRALSLEFPILFARIRDRISTLHAGFKAMDARAAAVRMLRCDLRHTVAARRSARNPRAAQWTGVGRQTVWGKGELE